MKKISVFSLLAVLMLTLAMAFTACSSGDDPYVPPIILPPGGGEAFSFEGPWDGVINTYGTNAPTIAGNDITITASSSTGFSIKYADIGYTYDQNDVLIFTYQLEVTTPKAVLAAKNPKDWSADLPAPAAWGTGKGREYVLGDTTYSNYTGPLVNGTWDGTTGTFEVQMSLLKGSDAIGFQHNYWADTNGDGVKIAENSVYKLTILKIENGVSELETEPEEPALTPEEQEANFVAAEGLKGLTNEWAITSRVLADATTGIIARDPARTTASLFSVDLPDGVTIIPTDTITIKYIAIVTTDTVKLTAKLPGGNTDLSPATYLDLVAEGTEKTLTIPAVRYAASMPTTKLSFQDNSAATAEWKLKIIDITVTHGDDIKVSILTIPSILEPKTGMAPVTSVNTIQYSGTVAWHNDTDDADLSGNFVLSKVYTATVSLTAKQYYTFNGVAANSFKVAGLDATNAAGIGGTLTVTKTFGATENLEDLEITDPVFTGWGGLWGDKSSFDMDTAQTNNCRITYVFPAIASAYTNITVSYTLTLKEGEIKPMKVIIKDSLKDNWGSTTGDEYKESSSSPADMTYTALVSKFTTGAITFAHNTDSAGSSSFNIKITKIKFSN